MSNVLEEASVGRRKRCEDGGFGYNEFGGISPEPFNLKDLTKTLQEKEV